VDEDDRDERIGEGGKIVTRAWPQVRREGVDLGRIAAHQALPVESSRVVEAVPRDVVEPVPREARPRPGAGAPVVLLSGGAGQRMGELTHEVPKPMLAVGGRPLLWHIMRMLAVHGTDEFVVALGHLGHVVKDYFLSFQTHAGDFTVRLGRHPVVQPLDDCPEEGWSVTCIDTGVHAATASRLRAVAGRVPRWPVVVAYGDVLADLDLDALLAFHRSHGRLATVTAASPPARFGSLDVNGDQVRRFREKEPGGGDELVNIGFFVLEREVIERYIPAGADVMFEEEPARRLAADGELMAHRHGGWWQPVDTPKELAAVRRLWDEGAAPWKVWR
jgi:glucose-1-phosphate cytidylyltransferase